MNIKIILLYVDDKVLIKICIKTKSNFAAYCKIRFCPLSPVFMEKIFCIFRALYALWAYRAHKTRLPYPPLILMVEPTSFCNLKCMMCPNADLEKNTLRHMEWDTFTKIVDEAKDFVYSIGLVFRGEPFLHPQLFDMVDYIAQYGIITQVHTNGTLFTPKTIDRLLHSKLDYLSISFDGHNKKSYEKFRKNANFQETVDGINLFLKTRGPRKKPYTILQTLLLDNEYINGFDKLHDFYYSTFEHQFIDEFALKLPTTWAKHFHGTRTFMTKEISDTTVPCSYLWAMLTILADGTITPCCTDFFGDRDYPFGNIDTISLLEVWNSEKVVKFRESMIHGDYLSLKKNCKGCDAIHCRPIWGLPIGLRRAISLSFVFLFGFAFEKFVKRILSITHKRFTFRVGN